MAYFSFTALFVTMSLVDTVATFLAWRGDLPKNPGILRGASSPP